MDYVIFSIDNWADLHTQAKFLRHLDTYRAMGKFNSDPILALGSYDGVMEMSFIMTGKDFIDFVLPTKYVTDQKSLMWVSQEKQMPFWVKDRDGNTLDSGRLVATSGLPDNVINWTYRDDLGKYFYKEVSK